MADLSGIDIDRYHLIEPHGQGGMAIVYKAYDNRLEREVAIKIIRRNAFSPDVVDRMLKRFDREAKSLAKLTHPNIVSIIDYGEYEGSPYLVMPYLPGGTLKEKLGKPMPYRHAAALLAPIADALAFAHQKGIVHRDIKPGNILITEGGAPMLSDFGIAKILEVEGGQTLTGTGVGVGTPEYMSPEQGLGKEIDERSDIYSLGVVFYELVTGHKPYTADTPMAVVLKQTTEPLPRPSEFVSGLPEEVERVLFKALAKKSEDRFASMNEMAQALIRLERADFGGNVKASKQPNAAAQPIPSEPDAYATVDQLEPETNDPIIFHETSETIQNQGETQPKTKLKYILTAVVGLIVIYLIIIYFSGRFKSKATPITAPSAAIEASLEIGSTQESPINGMTIVPTILPTTTVAPFFTLTPTIDNSPTPTKKVTISPSMTYTPEPSDTPQKTYKLILQNIHLKDISAYVDERFVAIVASHTSVYIYVNEGTHMLKSCDVQISTNCVEIQVNSDFCGGECTYNLSDPG